MPMPQTLNQTSDAGSPVANCPVTKLGMILSIAERLAIISVDLVGGCRVSRGKVMMRYASIFLLAFFASCCMASDLLGQGMGGGGFGSGALGGGGGGGFGGGGGGGSFGASSSSAAGMSGSGTPLANA